jgi:hypothetical protein
MGHVKFGQTERRGLNTPVEIDPGLLLIGDEEGLFAYLVADNGDGSVGRARVA